MAVVEGGTTGSLQEVGAAAALPAHITAKPLPYGALGQYRVSVVTGTLAATLAAGAVVFSARWSDATRFAVITRLQTRFLPLTPFTAATLTDATSFDAYIGRSFSAAHTGGTALTLTGSSFKTRASMGSTLFNDLRIATTAALGGGGTVTPDAHPFEASLRKGNRTNPAAATEETISGVDSNDLNFLASMSDGEHPIVLTANEGILIRNRTVWPAAGTGILLVQMSWAEVSAF